MTESSKLEHETFAFQLRGCKRVGGFMRWFPIGNDFAACMLEDEADADPDGRARVGEFATVMDRSLEALRTGETGSASVGTLSGARFERNADATPVGAALGRTTVLPLRHDWPHDACNLAGMESSI